MPTHGISLALVRAELIAEPTDDKGDAYILQALSHIAGRLELKFGFDFAPYIRTVFYDAIGDHINLVDGTFRLRQPLLVPSTVINGSTTLTLWDGLSGTRATSDFYGFPLNVYPITTLRRLPHSAYTWHGTAINSDYLDTISITGIWGYHRDYANAWLSSGDTTENNPLSSSATSITVNDAEGVDALYRAPRFSPGQLLRIESEFVEVVATTGTTLTVRRGVRGSTAASHVQNTAIDIWQPDAAIERATVRWVSYLYDRRGEFTSTKIDPMTQAAIKFPPDIPEEVEAILNELMPKRILAV